jgi:hypothetical protein
LEVPTVRGLLVGDPDQAIYEFNGAKPELFGMFKGLLGSRTLTLSESLRCPPEVCSVASELSDTGRRVRPQAGEAGVPGSATLLVYDRRNADIDKLTGYVRPQEKSLGSRPVELVRYAVQALRRGDQRRALTLAEAALAGVVFGHDSPTERDITQAGLSPADWKQTVVATLLDAEAQATLVSVYDWGCALKEVVRRRLEERGLWGSAVKPRALRAPHRQVATKLIWGKGRSSDTPRRTSLVFSTVHGVKGETHHTTVLFVPDLDDRRCPSAVWWSDEPTGREETRIAFVAATRARANFVLAVPRTVFGRLCASQPQFVDLFTTEELSV